MKKLLLLILVLMLVLEGAFRWIANWQSDAVLVYSSFFVLLDLVPYLALIVVLGKGNLYSLETGFKWFVLAVVLCLGIALLYVLGVNEVSLGSELYVYTIGGFSYSVVVPMFDQYSYVGLLLYWLPLLVLNVASLIRSNNAFMKRVSILSLSMMLAITLLNYVANWFVPNWLPLFVWITGLLWSTRRL